MFSFNDISRRFLIINISIDINVTDNILSLICFIMTQIIVKKVKTACVQTL